MEQREADNRRRLKIAYLHHDFLTRWLQYEQDLPEAIRFPSAAGKNVPEDAEIVSVHYNYAWQSFSVILRHDSFDVAPDGEELPRLDGGICIEWCVWEKQPDGSYRKAGEAGDEEGHSPEPVKMKFEFVKFAELERVYQWRCDCGGINIARFPAPPNLQCGACRKQYITKIPPVK